MSETAYRENAGEDTVIAGLRSQIEDRDRKIKNLEGQVEKYQLVSDDARNVMLAAEFIVLFALVIAGFTYASYALAQAREVVALKWYGGALALLVLGRRVLLGHWRG